MSAPVNSYLQPSAIVGSNATLASALVVNTTYTSLTVTAVATAYATGANITLLSGTSSQTVTTSAPVAVGATTIAVTSFTANFAYPVGTYVDPTYTPESQVAPGPYISAKNILAWLAARWPQFSTNPNGTALPEAEGLALAASMSLDEEGPFFGVKAIVTQEREWPRTFKYGWPNMIATPSPVLITEQRAGTFFLNYEVTVPLQVVDYVCLEYYRMCVQSQLVEVTSESVTGASVHYNHWTGEKGSVPAQLDRILWSLITPFQVQSAHTNAFPSAIG
jgi:hypothetical protein